MVVDGFEVRYDLRKFTYIVERDFSPAVRNTLLSHSAVIQKIQKHPLNAVANIAHIGGIEFISKCRRFFNRLSDRRRI